MLLLKVEPVDSDGTNPPNNYLAQDDDYNEKEWEKFKFFWCVHEAKFFCFSADDMKSKLIRKKCMLMKPHIF